MSAVVASLRCCHVMGVTVSRAEQKLDMRSSSSLSLVVSAGSIDNPAIRVMGTHQYSIGYKPGQHHKNTDALSRLPLPEAPGPVPVPADVVQVLSQIEATAIKSHIKSWTERDTTLAVVKKYCLTSWPQSVQNEQLRPYLQRKDEISIQDGCLLWGSRVIIPPQGQTQILNLLHETHPGVNRMKSLARCHVWCAANGFATPDNYHCCYHSD